MGLAPFAASGLGTALRRCGPITWVVLVGACWRPEGGSPAGLENTGALLLLSLAETGPGEGYSGLLVDGSLTRFSTRDPRSTHLLAYPVEAAKLGWQPGPMVLRSGGPNLCGPQLRPLPIPSQIWRLDEEGGWVATQEVPALRELCAPDPAMVDCLSNGGCYHPLPLGDPLFCDRSCAAPPLPPHPVPPRPVVPAEAPRLRCPNAASGGCDLGPGLCQGVGPPPAHAALYCRHQNDSCPEGPFAPAPLGSTPVYVAADATAPGEGTIAAPYRDLATALQQRPGAPVLLAAGEYVVPATLPDELWVIGACPRPTQLRGTLSGVSRLELQGLSIDGPLQVQTATLLDVRVIAPPLNREPLLQVMGSLVMRGVSLEGPADTGLELSPASDAHAQDVVSSNLQLVARLDGAALEIEGWQHHGPLGAGFLAIQGAELLAREVILGHVEAWGLNLSASTASIADVQIHSVTLPALDLSDGASTHLQRVALSSELGVTIQTRDSELRGHDLGVENVQSEATTVHLKATTVSLARVRLRCGKNGLVVEGSTSSPERVEIRDLEVESVSPCDEVFSGLVFLRDFSRLQLDRAHLRNSKIGVFIGPDAVLQGKDLEIGRQGPACRGDNGILVDDRGSVFAERVRLYNLADHGVLSQEVGSSLGLEDLEILGVDDTLPTTEAIALNLAGPQGPMPVTRAWIHGRFGPVLRLGAHSDLVVRDLTLEQRGLDVVAELNEQARLNLVGFHIQGSGGPGLITGNNSTFTLHDGVIRGLSPGLQTPTEPDRDRLEGLRFEDTPCAYEARDEANQCR